MEITETERKIYNHTSADIIRSILEVLAHAE